MTFEESKTKQNLLKALQGEALAHLKYQFYRSKLVDVNKKYENVLDEIIHNEKEHGKIWFKQLHDSNVPENNVNLEDAILGELYEANEMYLEFGATADEEGYLDIAYLFYHVADIERNHANKFKEIKDELNSKMFKSEEETYWKCLNCGYIHTGNEAPTECPICKYPQKYFTKYE